MNDRASAAEPLRDEVRVTIKPRDDNAAAHIYQQKYEMFRHWDKLRWEVPMVALASAAAVLAFAREKDEFPAWWALLLVGLLCALVAFTVYRIRQAIQNNRESLREVAEFLGDHSIPPQPRQQLRYSASTLLIGFFGVLAGVMFLAAAIRAF